VLIFYIISNSGELLIFVCQVLDEGLVEILTANRECVLRIRALPLPEGVADCILQHQEAIRTLDRLVKAHITQDDDSLQVCLSYFA
jgi:hypothetical protein